jgi:hypothetical protein
LVCPTARIVLTFSDVDDVPSSVLRDCGATAFVPKIELATADLDGLFNPDGVSKWAWHGAGMK